MLFAGVYVKKKIQKREHIGYVGGIYVGDALINSKISAHIRRIHI
jgi:hypothetical protein